MPKRRRRRRKQNLSTGAWVAIGLGVGIGLPALIVGGVMLYGIKRVADRQDEILEDWQTPRPTPFPPEPGLPQS